MGIMFLQEQRDTDWLVFVQQREEDGDWLKFAGTISGAEMSYAKAGLIGDKFGAGDFLLMHPRTYSRRDVEEIRVVAVTEFEAAEPDPIPARVLVIEDDRAVRDVLEETLVEKGAFVWCVSNLTEAADCVERDTRPYDFIVCDYDLPDGKGTEWINRYEGTATVILFSGLDRAAEIAAECPNRAPDETFSKEKLPELIERVAYRA